MAQIVGQRTTSHAISTENRLVRNINETIAELEPNIAPMLTLTLKMGKRSKTITPVMEFLEEDYIARYAASAATVGNTTSANTIAVDDGGKFAVGDVFNVPKAIASSTAPEIVRVTTISGNTITVTRAFAGSTIDTIGNGAALRLIGSAHEEGGVLPNAKTGSPVTLTSYTQIFKRIIDFSNTLIASKQYGDGGSERKRQHKKALKEFKEQLNAALLWGKASQNLSGGENSKPLRTTMGLNSRISTNVVDAGGVLTPKLFMTFLEAACRYGSREKLLLSSSRVVQAVNAWAINHLNVTTSETVYGVKIQKIMSPFGVEFMLVNDWMLEDNVANQGFKGLAYVVDLECIEYKYLEGDGENRDTKLTENVVLDGADRKVDQILAEVGFIIGEEKKHAKLFNVTDYQA